MERNNRLLFEILEWCESNCEPGIVDYTMKDGILEEMSEKNERILAGHIHLLIEEGLIEGNTYIATSSISINRMTSRGHDFLEVSRQPDLLEKLRTDLKNAPIDTFLSIGKDLISTMVKQKLGLEEKKGG